MTPNVNFFIKYTLPMKELKKLKTTKQEYKDRRKFFSCKKDYNFVGYVDKGSKEKIDFVDYSGNSEKSTGVFNESGLLSKEQKQALKKRLARTGSPIWYGLISFEELFGKEHCNFYEQAYELMKTEFPRFLKTAGFDVKNIEWFAGLHTNTDHRHIHFSFYEKKEMKKLAHKDELKFSTGKVNVFSVKKAKVDIELRLRNLKEIHSGRDELLKKTKGILSSAGLNDFIYRNIRDLGELLPKEKRFSYSSENIKPYKKLIDNVTKTIIKNNKELNADYEKFVSEVLSKDKEIIEICKKSKINHKYFLLEKKYIGDLNRRLGNAVLKAIKEIEFKEKRAVEVEYKNRLVEKRIQKNKRKKLIRKANYLRQKVEIEAFQYLNELTRKLENYKYENILNERGEM